MYYILPMAMGKRKRNGQPSLSVAATDFRTRPVTRSFVDPITLPGRDPIERREQHGQRNDPLHLLQASWPLPGYVVGHTPATPIVCRYPGRAAIGEI